MQPGRAVVNRRAAHLDQPIGIEKERSTGPQLRRLLVVGWHPERAQWRGPAFEGGGPTIRRPSQRRRGAGGGKARPLGGRGEEEGNPRGPLTPLAQQGPGTQ